VRQQSEAPAQQNTRVSHALYPEALGQPPRTPAAAPAPEARPADEAERKPAGRRGSKLLSPELKQAIAAHEKEEISRALAKVGGNQTEAAKLLKVSRRTLIERIKAYGLPQPRKARARQA
jgi:DNA-binding NtrC family response regulator